MVNGNWYLALDFGGSKGRAVVAQSDAHFSNFDVVSEDRSTVNGPLSVSEQMIYLGNKAIKKRRINVRDVKGVGVISAGPFNFDIYSGSIINSANMKFPQTRNIDINKLKYFDYDLPEGFIYKENKLIKKNPNREDKRDIIIPVVEPLVDNFKVPVYLGNDVNVATIGIVIFGEGKRFGDPKDLKYTGVGVTHGTGFGGGVWTRGGILWGVDGNAAEVGHARIFENGVQCGCDHYGCAETAASGSGLAKLGRRILMEHGYNSELFNRAKGKSNKYSNSEMDKEPTRALEHVDSELIFEVYNNYPNDKVAKRIVNEVAKAIGVSYGIISVFYNPSFIANFGGLTKQWNHLEGIVMDELRRSCNVRIPEVFPTKLKDDVGLKGALGFAQGLGK